MHDDTPDSETESTDGGRPRWTDYSFNPTTRGAFNVVLMIVVIEQSKYRRSHSARPIMKQHEFTLILNRDPDDDEADTLYGVFQDGSICTVNGVPLIDFHREAPTLEEAIRSAVQDVRSLGFHVARVEIEPDTVCQTS